MPVSISTGSTGPCLPTVNTVLQLLLSLAKRLSTPKPRRPRSQCPQGGPENREKGAVVTEGVR